MKRSIVLMLCLSFTYFLSAQIGINIDAATNGILQVRASSATNPTSQTGMIIPRVNSLNNSPKANGILVYLQKKLSETQNIGFYYWSSQQNKWIPLMSRYSYPPH